MPDSANDIIAKEFGDDYIDKIKTEYGLPRKDEIDYFSNYYRFGVIDPYHELQSGREFLFFTKPDLYILKSDSALTSELESYPFFQDLLLNYKHVIYQLQSYRGPDRNPFAYLLSNMVDSNLDLPALSASTVQTPTNMFGTSYDYRWTSESSDDGHQFSLEFKDTKFLDTYMLFRAYEEYERLKAQGVVRLSNAEDHYRNYIFNKVLHDQFGIYKFIVSDDMETIVHYSYFCGCFFSSLPRDSFNDANFDEGVKYAIDIKCAFMEDMNPMILSDFNNLISSYNTKFTSSSDMVSIYDFENGKTDLLPVSSPIIVRELNYDPSKGYTDKQINNMKSSYNNRYVYKLKWYRKI